MEDMTDLIVLSDDEGNEVEVEIVTRMEIEDVEYFIVSPVESDEDEPIFTALKVVYDEEGEEFFETVDDDVEIAMIEEAYSVMFDEEGLN